MIEATERPAFMLQTHLAFESRLRNWATRYGPDQERRPRSKTEQLKQALNAIYFAPPITFEQAEHALTAREPAPTLQSPQSWLLLKAWKKRDEAFASYFFAPHAPNVYSRKLKKEHETRPQELMLAYIRDRIEGLGLKNTYVAQSMIYTLSGQVISHKQRIQPIVNVLANEKRLRDKAATIAIVRDRQQRLVLAYEEKNPHFLPPLATVFDRLLYASEDLLARLTTPSRTQKVNAPRPTSPAQS